MIEEVTKAVSFEARSRVNFTVRSSSLRYYLQQVLAPVNCGSEKKGSWNEKATRDVGHPINREMDK